LKICHDCSAVNIDSNVVCVECSSVLKNSFDYEESVKMADIQHEKRLRKQRNLFIFFIILNLFGDAICLLFAHFRYNGSESIILIILVFQIVGWLNLVFPELFFRIGHSIVLESYELSEGYISFNQGVTAIALVILFVAMFVVIGLTAY